MTNCRSRAAVKFQIRVKFEVLNIKMGRFTIEEENFVVQQYLKVPQPTDITVKRAFRKEFYPKNSRKLADTGPADFRRIYERFKNNGIRRPQQKNETNERVANPVTTELVKDVFDENPRKTIEEAKHELEIPNSTVF